MRVRRLAAAALAALCAAAAAAGDPLPFRLGVQTHFEQNWDLSLIRRARELGAVALRDEISWSKAERVPGEYDFTVADRYMLPILKQGMEPLIVINGRNPLYDGGLSPYTPEGHAALARFLSAVLDRYGADRVALEIGNEVNTEDFLEGPATEDLPGNIAGKAAAVRAELSRSHPGVQIMCTGVNTLALGFLRRFFELGGLDSCDAISVHPYRDNPDTLLEGMQRLQAVMREAGGEKPVHATEFGNWFDDPEDAPAYMLRMVALLGAAGAGDVYWYALADEPWWPNMGLLDDHRREKPAAAAFRFLQEELLPLGRPRALEHSTSVRLIEFGSGGRGFAAWGSGGRLEVAGQAQFFDPQGRPVESPSSLTDTPVVILGEGISLRIAEGAAATDTRYGFGRLPWSYFARTPDGADLPLRVTDSNWASFIGHRDLAPLRITDTSLVTARLPEGAYSPAERFTAPAAGRYRISGFWRALEGREPSQLRIEADGRLLMEAEAGHSGLRLEGLEVRMEAGSALDFVVSPAGENGDGALRRRITLSPVPGGG